MAAEAGCGKPQLGFKRQPCCLQHERRKGVFGDQARHAG
jgi:hypothetical protein